MQHLLGFFTQAHLTVCQREIMTFLQHFQWEVMHSPDVKNQVADAWYCRHD
jgi:hypothetical protein